MITRSMLRASWNDWLAIDYRRSKAGFLGLPLVWTLLISLLIALGFTVLGFVLYASGSGAWRNLAGWWHWYQLNAWVSVWIGVIIHGLFVLAVWWLTPQVVGGLRGLRRAAFYSGIPIVGVLIGWPLSIWMLGDEVKRWLTTDNANVWIGLLLTALLINLVVQQMFSAKARQILAERAAAESQLQLLQAQIEPHFLFNTLANVLSLIDSEPERARRMLEAFTDYLRSSLGELRRTDVSLKDELALATAYLQVQHMRMEDRLRFVIDADDAAQAARLPPLLVQPLVENAIAHGLEGKVEGGTVTLRARRHGERLVIEVDDDGLGLAPHRPGPGSRAGNGVALRNLRERLAGRFGDQARLTLEPLSPGTRSRLDLPYETAPPPATPTTHSAAAPRAAAAPTV